MEICLPLRPISKRAKHSQRDDKLTRLNHTKHTKVFPQSTTTDPPTIGPLAAFSAGGQKKKVEAESEFEADFAAT